MPGYIMTRLEAKKVLDAFGPCTNLYECNSERDLIAQASEYDSLFDMLDTLVSCEDARADSWLGGIADGGEGDHAGACEEWKRSYAAIKERLVASFPGYDFDKRQHDRQPCGGHCDACNGR